MLGIEHYGSGSESDSSEVAAPESTLPAPSCSTSSSSTKFSLPPPKRTAKKMAIGLPTLTSKYEEEDDLKDERPQSKRPRLESGAGASSLVSMLPAPKQKPLSLPAPGRVLGGGKGKGSAFDTLRPPFTSNDVPGSHDDGDTMQEASQVPEEELSAPDATTNLPILLPPSFKKKRTNISLDEYDFKSQKSHTAQKPDAPAVDFFSLGNSSSFGVAPSAPSTSDSVSSSSIAHLSSAPAIPTFEPPEPSPTDAYPGYYQLPSGTWAAHDPVYYAKFVKKWQKDYDAQVRALEKRTAKGFEGFDSAAVEEVDAVKEMEKAKLELRIREERKAVTQGVGGAPAQPNMRITASKMSGIARSRHQLSTLLKEAYENREALEEKIAQGKRNRKEAGNKYGF